MRVRCLRQNDLVGTKAAVVDGMVSVTNCRFFVDYGQVLEIQNIVVVDSDFADIILLSGCSARVSLRDFEIHNPASLVYQPSDCGCKK